MIRILIIFILISIKTTNGQINCCYKYNFNYNVNDSAYYMAFPLSQTYFESAKVIVTDTIIGEVMFENVSGVAPLVINYSTMIDNRYSACGDTAYHQILIQDSVVSYEIFDGSIDFIGSGGVYKKKYIIRDTFDIGDYDCVKYMNIINLKHSRVFWGECLEPYVMAQIWKSSINVCVHYEISGTFLPLTLLTARVYSNNGINTVGWTTASEHNISSYLIQKSAYASVYKNVHQIAPMYETENEYIWSEVATSPTTYYRLSEITMENDTVPLHIGSATVTYNNPIIQTEQEIRIRKGRMYDMFMREVFGTRTGDVSTYNKMPLSKGMYIIIYDNGIADKVNLY